MHVATQVAKLAIAKVEVRDWDLEVRTNIPDPCSNLLLRAAGGHTPGDLGHVTRRALFLTLQSGTAALVVPLDKPGAILHPFRAVLERVAARAPVVAVARETALVVVAQLVDDAGAVRSVADLS